MDQIMNNDELLFLNFLMEHHSISKSITRIIGMLKSKRPHERIQIEAEVLKGMIDASNNLLLRDTQFKFISVYDLMNFFMGIQQIRFMSEKCDFEYICKIPLETEVYSTKKWIISIFGNLIDNAINWCNEDGHVKLWALDQGEEIHFIIGNTGPEFNIEFEDSLKLYNTTREGGSGVGLFVGDKLAQLSKGRLFKANKDDYDEIPKEFNALVGVAFSTNDNNIKY